MSSGLQTVVRFVSASQTAAVIPTLACALAIQPVGDRSAKMSASALATATATPWMGTAPVMQAGGLQRASNHASVPLMDLKASAVISSQASVTAAVDSGG